MIPSIETGGLIWITGLSASGKTTIAKELMKFYDNKAIMLDGDELRKILNTINTGYDYDGRKKIAFIYAGLCRMLADQGALVICSTISMFDDVRNYNKENNKYYCEIFINISEEERMKRDPKQLYKKYRDNQLNNMAGVDFKVEYPKSPHITITEQYTIEESVSTITNYLKGE